MRNTLTGVVCAVALLAAPVAVNAQTIHIPIPITVADDEETMTVSSDGSYTESSTGQETEGSISDGETVETDGGSVSVDSSDDQ